jgi:3-oxoadipate enol-lactonase
MELIESNEARLAYRWDGSDGAPVLLLAHSLGVDLHMWNAQIASLATRFHILRYDIRGHGRSSAPRGPYTIEQLGRDVLNLLDALDVARVSFCGLSMGGMVGQWLGINAPERLQRLVLCNTAAVMPPPGLWDQRIDTVLAEGMQALTPAILQRWFTPAFQQAEPAAVAPIEASLNNANIEGYAGCCAAVRDMDLRSELARINIPTLIIAGDQDASTPLETARFIAGQIAGSCLAVLTAAHLSNIEAAADFNRTLLDFLTAPEAI